MMSRSAVTHDPAGRDPTLGDAKALYARHSHTIYTIVLVTMMTAWGVVAVTRSFGPDRPRSSAHRCVDIYRNPVTGQAAARTAATPGADAADCLQHRIPAVTVIGRDDARLGAP